MSATNSTTHYEFPVFVGSDKPAWLVDWNGAMQAIDSAIYEAKSTADSAVASAASIASDLLTLSGTVSTQGSSITTLSETLTTAVGNINTINGNINTINSLIGNGTPTTTDQTIIGAINEINAKVSRGSVTVTADGVKTVGELVIALTGLIDFSKITNQAVLEFFNGNITMHFHAAYTAASSIRMFYAIVTAADIQVNNLTLSATSPLYEQGSAITTNSTTDKTSEVPTSGSTLKFYY